MVSSGAPSGSSAFLKICAAFMGSRLKAVKAAVFDCAAPGRVKAALEPKA